MKKFFIITLLVLVMACNKANEPVSQNNAAENKSDTNTDTNTQETAETKEEPKIQNIAEKGGEIKVVLSAEGQESEIYLISASERKGGFINEYLKKEAEKKLESGERFYFLTVKIKNGGESPLAQIDPEFFQVETEDGTLYKRNYTITGDASELSDTMDIDDIPVGASREVKLSYRINGEVKSLDFVLNGEIGGKVMLK